MWPYTHTRCYVALRVQTLPWYNNADILQNIIDFYTKAKAYEQLSTFFEACASVEIGALQAHARARRACMHMCRASTRAADEYRNYEKALAAYKEALKNSHKIKTDIRDARVASLNGAERTHAAVARGGTRVPRCEPRAHMQPASPLWSGS